MIVVKAAVVVLGFILSSWMYFASFGGNRASEGIIEGDDDPASTRAVLPRERPPTVEELIKEYARRWRVDEERVLSIARCESGVNLNPNAQNPTSSAKGVFQIIDSTERAWGINALNVNENVEQSIRHMALGQWSHWKQCDK
ncbi:MAG: hypothetical protein A2Z24_00825 [Candidatus Woykebacteria bacterium RBG_16_44_10]|uniref:Transglycosylase SLT domain-containing protein n=1 Tax=Candidatus Woykebacteria bacterium RBG_16_44_10 TaxID=1802597 RepID=A0A1G1WGD7_9BACT|nr:MAG: hypothetical protein A2Z24_00825 [Candidatus Woykebacteria bacterium RBG_16_44_10]